jgi:hypothetical protein
VDDDVDLVAQQGFPQCRREDADPDRGNRGGGLVTGRGHLDDLDLGAGGAQGVGDVPGLGERELRTARAHANDSGHYYFFSGEGFELATAAGACGSRQNSSRNAFA